MREPKEVARFTKYLFKNPDNKCWEWTGYINKSGYGSFRYDGEKRGSHRFSYLHYKGNIPEGLEVDHICKNRKCSNPDHLRLLTKIENLEDAFHSKKLSNREFCEKGHRLSKDNIIDKKDGTFRCRQCKRDYQRNWAMMKRLAQ